MVISIAANTAASPRVGLLTVAGQTVTVTQQGTVSCAFTVSPTTVTSAEAAAPRAPP